MSETKMAVSPKTAKKNIEQLKPYRQTFKEANRKTLKILIGETLICLVAGIDQPYGWQLFDGLLRRFYARGEI